MNLPKGFTASGVASGVKKQKLDLGLVYSEKNAVCVGFFTSNRIKAASLLLTKDRIKNPHHKAVVMNSGCANCLTGKSGILDSKIVTKKIAGLLNIGEKETLICSTGIIGKRLNVKKIVSASNNLVRGLSKNGIAKFAKAIMTTDTYPKKASCSFKAGKKMVMITGIAKGAGMISPKMATLLCVIITDADIKKKHLKIAVKHALDSSFNCITVDADTSTNDTLLVLANGESKVKIKPGTALYKKFASCLNYVALSLAKMIAKDGEGATKFIQIDIIGAKTINQAKKVAMAIANSNLVKTAIYGNDPNIGRVASSCGAAGEDIKPSRLDIYFNGKKAVSCGVAIENTSLRNIFKRHDINIKCNLNIGKASYTAYTCDLTPEYVKINADYS